MKGFIAAACVVGLIAGSVANQDRFSPARFTGGAAPDLPALAVGGGQVFVELSVGADGRVSKVSMLRSTPPFTDAVVNVVRGWQFKPAEELQADPKQPNGPPIRKTIASTVIVAAVFRAPTMLVPTLGETPRDVAPPSADAAFPTFVSEPPQPPLGRDPGVVLMEVRLDASGRINAADVIRSSPGHDEAARTALRQWVFRPGRALGTRVPTYVYVIFGFPVPVT